MTVPSLWVTLNIQQEQNPSLLFSTAEIWGSFVTMPYHVLTDTHGVLNTVPGSEELVAYGTEHLHEDSSVQCPVPHLSHLTALTSDSGKPLSTQSSPISTFPPPAEHAAGLTPAPVRPPEAAA